MVDFPPYIRLVPNTALRRAGGQTRSQDRSQEATHTADSRGCSLPTDVYLRRTEETFSLVSQENRLAANSEIPTADQAAQALRRLQKDLPALGKGVDNLHSKLDSRRILDLLAPLI